MIKRTLPVLACFCVVVMFGLDYWERLEKLPSIPEHPEIIDESTTENFETDIVITMEISQTQTVTTVAVPTTETEALSTSVPAAETESITEIQTVSPAHTTAVIKELCKNKSVI